MKSLKNFFKTFILAANPITYSTLRSRTLAQAFRYFLSLVFVLLFLGALSLLPQIGMLPGSVNNALEKFDELRIDVEHSTNEPVLLPARNPIVIIDTSGERDSVNESRILITNSSVIYRRWWGAQKASLDEFSNLLDQKHAISRYAVMMFIMMLPTMLAVAYAFLAIRYLVYAAVATAIVYLLLRLLKKKIRIAELFSIALYAITPMIVLELVEFIIGPLSFIPEIVLLAYLIVATFIKEKRDVQIKQTQR